MFFIRCGSVIAWVLILLGLLRMAIGLFTAFSKIDINMPAAVVQYLGDATSGQVILDGMMTFAAGIVMGLLVQIAKGVKFD